MKYVVLVSHGMFAPGLHNALGMLAGENREDILSTSLENGMGADQFAENFRKLVSVVGKEDEILLFADLLGGSPLTVSANVLAQEGLMKDELSTEELKDTLISEAQDGIGEFRIDPLENDDDI